MSSVKRSKIWTTSREVLAECLANSEYLSDVLRTLGMAGSSENYGALKERLRQDDIDYSHIALGLSCRKGKTTSLRSKTPLTDILVEHSTYGRTELKRRLLKEGLLKNQCYECGIGPEWNDKPLSLQIDHINGVSDDNRLENLRILCPNCHAQTPTFGAKRRRKPRLSDVNPNWRHDPKPSTRKVERPTKDVLGTLIQEKAITEIAKTYGVRDNTVRKWVKWYGLTLPKFDRGYWVKTWTEETIPAREELAKLIQEMPGKDICKAFGIDKKTLNKWLAHHNITRPPPGYWKRKENIR